MAEASEEDLALSAGGLRECRAAYDAWSRFVVSRAGLVIMFLWAAAEATVWPIIPDFLLVPMALGARRRTARPFLAALAGMALGGSVTFLVASAAPDRTLSLLRHLPLVTNAQIGHARARLLNDGALAFWSQPWSGIPFKVWAVLAGGMHLDAPLVIPTFILARGLRMAVFAAVAGLLASWFTRFFRDFSLFLAVIYVVFFLYGWWQVMSMS